MAGRKSQALSIRAGQSERFIAFTKRVDGILDAEAIPPAYWSFLGDTAVVRFEGEQAEGWRAFGAVMTHGLPLLSLRRAWEVRDGEPCGPHWELAFLPPDEEG
jgi:hypothetical protein